MFSTWYGTQLILSNEQDRICFASVHGQSLDFYACEVAVQNHKIIIDNMQL